jgi:hypothetical protein
MIIKNISNFEYFLQRADMIDMSYRYHVKYHSDAPRTTFDSPETFVIEFHNCRVNSCPLLITESNEMITEYVWPLLHKYKHKPKKTHGLWKDNSWGDTIEIDLPPVTRSFGEPYKFVWLPIDKESANNPWHVWIDMISKFRLLEKRYAIDYENQIYVLSQKSEYFEKVAKELFPNLKFLVMPENTTWHFDHLIVPSMSNSSDGIVAPELPNWLRTKFGINNNHPHRKIFISREDAPARKLVNAEELFMTLKGWEKIILSKLSIREQIKIFSEAKNVISTHGAGLLNIVWCQTGAHIIEIAQKELLSKKVYPVLSFHLGHKHNFLLGEKVSLGDKKPSGVKRLKDFNDLKINLSNILNILNNDSRHTHN